MTEAIESFNRVEFAIDLRKAGLSSIDFEDWDGLTDGQVLGLVHHMHQIVNDPNFGEEYTHEV